MKKLLAYATVTTFLFVLSFDSNAQGMFDKLKQKVKDKVNQRIDDKENKAIDKTLDNVDGTNSSKTENSDKNSNGVVLASNKEKIPTAKSYANYDFVPGDKIIFQSQIADEQIGEIPSQFTVSEGQLDVQMEDGEKVLHTLKGATITFTPRMTTTTYMPDQFTVEFDFKNEKYGVGHMNIDFGHRVYYSGGEGILPGMTFGGDNSINWINGDVKYPEALDVNFHHPMEWHHIAIAINKTVGKVYIDQYRVINLNNLSGKPNNVTFNINGYEDSYFKNIRIASGGIDIYKKVTSEGKIITHGILFDVDKSTFKPESMGTINSIYNLLKGDPSLKFEIDGHTDNTGTSAHNLSLSQERADAVKEKLVSMGIIGSRLTTKGFGDTKPIDKNETPEGKANNRRVEFIKI